MNKNVLPFLLAVTVAPALHALEAQDKCMADALKLAGENDSAADIRSQCSDVPDVPERLRREAATEQNPSVLTPHRQNYILPFSYITDPNQRPYNDGAVYDVQDPVKNQEAKFQLSIKAPLTYTPMLSSDDVIYFGVTLKSFWQVYNDDISAPFRETNYQPEVFYRTSLPWRPAGGMTLLGVGLEHQSNGRSQTLSRSWNRAYFAFTYLKDDWAVSIRPWHRLAEDAKEDDGDPDTPLPSKGDDNPDISEYMGHHELTGVYTVNDMEFSWLSRLNFETGYGAVEAGWSFPLYGRMRGFVQYFNGYGESLIDYNEKIERLGVGFLLTDLY